MIEEMLETNILFSKRLFHFDTIYGSFKLASCKNICNVVFFPHLGVKSTAIFLESSTTSASYGILSLIQ